MQRKTMLMVGAGLLLAACTQKGSEALPADAPVMPKANETYIVATNTIMRIAPTDDDAIPHPRAPEVVIHNQIGAITRGQMATLRRSVPFWSEVVLQDDAEGWIHTDALIPASQVTELAAMDEVTLYAAPNIDAPVVGEATVGELLFGLEDNDSSFAKVWVAGAGKGYVPTHQVSQAKEDVAMSHLLIHARLAASMRDMDEASETLDRARIRYPQSKLMTALADTVDFNKLHATPKSHQSNMDPVPPPPRLD